MFGRNYLRDSRTNSARFGSRSGTGIADVEDIIFIKDGSRDAFHVSGIRDRNPVILECTDCKGKLFNWKLESDGYGDRRGRDHHSIPRGYDDAPARDANHHYRDDTSRNHHGYLEGRYGDYWPRNDYGGFSRDQGYGSRRDDRDGAPYGRDSAHRRIVGIEEGLDYPRRYDGESGNRRNDHSNSPKTDSRLGANGNGRFDNNSVDMGFGNRPEEPVQGSDHLGPQETPLLQGEHHGRSSRTDSKDLRSVNRLDKLEKKNAELERTESRRIAAEQRLASGNWKSGRKGQGLLTPYQGPFEELFRDSENGYQGSGNYYQGDRNDDSGRRHPYGREFEPFNNGYDRRGVLGRRNDDTFGRRDHRDNRGRGDVEGRNRPSDRETEAQINDRHCFMCRDEQEFLKIQEDFLDSEERQNARRALEKIRDRLEVHHRNLQNDDGVGYEARRHDLLEKRRQEQVGKLTIKQAKKSPEGKKDQGSQDAAPKAAKEAGEASGSGEPINQPGTSSGKPSGNPEHQDRDKGDGSSEVSDFGMVTLEDM